MSINKVEYIPNKPFSNTPHNNANQDLKTLQKQKWGVLFGTFMVIVVLANIWIWTREPIFESQAILHFTFPSQTELEFSQLAQRKVEAHQQKLLSNSVLKTVFLDLEHESGYTFADKNHNKLFAAEVSGRLITLSAKHTNREILQPALESWINNYLVLESSEKKKNNTEEINSANMQLDAIEDKITVKQQQVTLFAQENDITSLERDENRVLNKIKALSANIDSAIAGQTAAQALFNSLEQSVKKGQPIIRDIDKTQINSTQQQLQLLKSELSALGEKYTQAYLSRDPSIVRKQQSLVALEQSLVEQLNESQTYYLQDAERDLEASKDKVIQTQEQFEIQNKQAQIFSQKLQQYKIINAELSAIQEQAQTIRNNIIEQEVSQPFDAKISILEPPFTPDLASGPDYWYMTIISLLSATGASVFALLLFGYIVKQKQPNNGTNFVVMPSQTMNNNLDQLSLKQQASLHTTELNLRLNEKSNIQPSTLRLLTAHENQALFAVANKQGKALLVLIYSGLNLNEIFAVVKVNFADSRVINSYANVQVTGEYARTLMLNENYGSALRVLCENKSDDDSIWSNIKSVDDFTQIIINAAHDAELSYPEQLNVQVLRHTYITYLVAQGARLSDLEQIIGYISPNDLAQYRIVKRQGQSIDIVDVNLTYPLIV